MKEKIIIFIIGLLIGAIISTGSIYIYTLINKTNNMSQPTEISRDNNFGNQNGNTPPEMPNNNITNN